MKAIRFPYRKSETTQWNGERFNVDLGGELTSTLTGLLGPSPEQIRGMLQSLREQAQLSLGHLAAVLGAPKATVRKWLDGSRNPSRATRKLIWLLHSLAIEQIPIYDLAQISHWSRGPGEPRQLWMGRTTNSATPQPLDTVSTSSIPMPNDPS